jgi:hypothetical protein
MSEIKLNLIDSQRVLHGMVHASVADRAIASLTAEPETISELELAFTRFEKATSETGHFALLTESSVIDEEPWDAGLMVIDLPARMVAVESTYSYPDQEGQVTYHDAEHLCELNIPYRISDEWQFVDSIEEYTCLRDERLDARKANPPLDARAVLYGPSLVEFIVQESRDLANSPAGDMSSENGQSPRSCDTGQSELSRAAANHDSDSEESFGCESIFGKWRSQIHAKWLSTSREDLRNLSPRDIILANQNFIDFDLQSRELQWSFQNEGPPCLPLDSDAYRFAGFGTHEWVIYYDLVRHLIRESLNLCYVEEAIDIEPDRAPASADNPLPDAACSTARVRRRDLAPKDLTVQLQKLLASWLGTPNQEYNGRTPANLIQSERQRLPIAMSPRDMIIDDDCPICRAMAENPEFNMGVGFWHLDSSHMNDGFVFSSFLTQEEWEADRLRWKEFNENFACEHAGIEAAMSAGGGKN